MGERLPDSEQERLSLRLGELDELIHIKEQAEKMTGKRQPGHDQLIAERNEINQKLHHASGDE